MSSDPSFVVLGASSLEIVMFAVPRMPLETASTENAPSSFPL